MFGTGYKLILKYPISKTLSILFINL